MQTIMVEPVGGNCNLRCIYCYQEPVRRNFLKIMPVVVLEKIISDSLRLSDKIKFLWHGGEPLLAGKKFFERAVELQKKHKITGTEIVNSIQTNATLIDKDWAEFFAKEDFKIGTSLDGPKAIHDKCRSSSYQKVVSGIKFIQATGKSVGVVITVTPENVDSVELIWGSLIRPKEIATSFEVNICSLTEYSRFTPSDEKSLFFFKRLFELWITHDDPEIYIKTLWVVLRFLLGGRTADCAFEYNKCSKFVAINEEGEVFVCNRFMNRPIAYLGNILEQSLTEIISSENARNLYHQIARIKDECRVCEWLMCCGGGCAFQRWMGKGRFDAGFPECNFRKEFFSYVKNFIQNRT